MQSTKIFLTEFMYNVVVNNIITKQSSGGVLYRFRDGVFDIYLVEHSSSGHVLPKGGKEGSCSKKAIAS